MMQRARSRYSMTTWRDGVGKEVGGGSEGGDTCMPMADSDDVRQKHHNIVK